MTWTKYRRTAIAEMRPYRPDENMNGISISQTDHPQFGGMIARNPLNHADQWYVSPGYFLLNFAPLTEDPS